MLLPPRPDTIPPGEEENRTRPSATSSNPARSSAGLWRRRRSGQGRQALQPTGRDPIRAGHDPGGVLSFAAGVVVRTGPLGSPGLRGRWPTASARAGAPDHRPSNERRPRFRRYGPAPNHPDHDPGRATDGCAVGCPTAAPPQERWRVKRGGHRDGPRAAGEAWRDPMALLVAGRAVCRFCCRTVGEPGAAWTIRKFPSTVQAYQCSIPRLAQPALAARTTGWKRAKLCHVTTPGRSPGVVTRTRLPDSAAGLRADGQTREARERT